MDRCAVCTSVCLAMLTASCGSPRSRKLEARGVRAYLASGDEAPRDPGSVRPLRGDAILEDEILRVLVGGPGRPYDQRGALLEVRLRGAPIDDGIERLSADLEVDGVRLPLRLRTIGLRSRDGRPALRIAFRAADTHGRRFQVERELAIGRIPTAVSIYTHVGLVSGPTAARVELLTRVGWGGARAFVPFVGFVTDDAPHPAEWIGRQGESVATLLGQRGPPPRHRARWLTRVDTRFLAATESISEPVDLRRGQGFVVAQLIALSDQGLGGAVRALGWRWSRPFPELVAALPHRPAGTEVHVDDGHGRPWLVSRVGERARVVLPLPRESADAEGAAPRAWASAWGHAPSETLAVRPGATVRLVVPRGGRMRVSIRDAETGAPLLARVRVIAVDPRRAISLGPSYRAAGAIDTVLTATGEALVPLPSGRYRVVATHGVEWTMGAGDVSVTESYQPHAEIALRHVVDPGPWVGCDFHVHQAPSPDSQVSLHDRVLSLAAEGVGFAVPTDHNHVTRYDGAARALGLRGFASTSGVEVTTWDPEIGHFGAFPVPLDPSLPDDGAPAYQETSPSALFEALHAISTDTVVQVNHPRLEPHIGYFDLYDYDASTGRARAGFSEGFDLLEVWNGYDLARPDAVDGVFAEWMALLSRGLRKVATGNSDSHSIRFQLPGYPRTYVARDDPAEPAVGIVRSAREGRAFVTNGPFVEASIDGVGPGELARAREGRVVLHLSVRAAPWVDVRTIEVFVGPSPAVVRTLPRELGPTGGRPPPPPVVRFEGAIPLDVGSDTFVVVRVRGEQAMEPFYGKAEVVPLAFTNPIFIDGDGDGEVRWLTPARDATVDGGVSPAMGPPPPEPP